MRWTRGIGVALAALALSGCTLVPATSTPQLIAKRSVPFALASPTIPFSSVTRVTYSSHPIYLLDSRHQLRSVTRLLPSPATLLEVLSTLALGPTASERGQGVTTALPSSMHVNQAIIKRGVASIDLNQVLEMLSPSEQRLAVAQLTLSALQSGAVNGITITLYAEPYALTVNGHRVTRFTPAMFQKDESN